MVEIIVAAELVAMLVVSLWLGVGRGGQSEIEER